MRKQSECFAESQEKEGFGVGGGGDGAHLFSFSFPHTLSGCVARMQGVVVPSPRQVVQLVERGGGQWWKSPM